MKRNTFLVMKKDSGELYSDCPIFIDMVKGNDFIQ